MPSRPSRVGPRARKGPSLLRRALFAFVPVAALLAVAETTCRLLPHEDLTETRLGYVVPDDDLIWKLDPESRGPLAVNSLGLRDGRMRWSADETILLLGDSVAWGDAIADRRACFPSLVEGLLDDSRPGRVHEVVNASVPGYSTFQQLEWLRIHGRALQPDLVVLQFCLNDVTERYHVLATHGGDNLFLGVDTRAAGEGLRGFLFEHSRAFERLLRALQSRARDRSRYHVQGMARDELSPELEEAWRHALDEVDAVRALSDELGSPFMLVVTPYAFQTARPEALRQPQERLIAWGRQAQVPVVDLLPVFAAQREPARLFLDENHFSVEGHALAARAIAPAIRAWLARTQDEASSRAPESLLDG